MNDYYLFTDEGGTVILIFGSVFAFEQEYNKLYREYINDDNWKSDFYEILANRLDEKHTRILKLNPYCLDNYGLKLNGFDECN